MQHTWVYDQKVAIGECLYGICLMYCQNTKCGVCSACYMVLQVKSNLVVNLGRAGRYGVRAGDGRRGERCAWHVCSRNEAVCACMNV